MKVEDRGEPSVELDKGPAVAIRQPSPAPHFAPQNDQLLSERRILRLEPALGLEWRSQHGQKKADQRDHYANLTDLTLSMRMRFPVHTAGWRRPGMRRRFPHSSALSDEISSFVTPTASTDG